MRSMFVPWLIVLGQLDGPVTDWIVLGLRVSIVMALVSLALLMAVIGVCHGVRARFLGHRLYGA